MYHVPTTPRPPLARTIIRCLGYGASRGACCGLSCGAFYGLGVGTFMGLMATSGVGIIFFMAGTITGGLIGLAAGAALGALVGMICGVMLHHRAPAYFNNIGANGLSAAAQRLRIAITLSSTMAYVVGGYVLQYGDHLLERMQQQGLLFLLGAGLWMTIIPSLIAGLCGYVVTGRLLRRYVNRWVTKPRRKAGHTLPVLDPAAAKATE
jgi:hypothetical protein